MELVGQQEKSLIRLFRQLTGQEQRRVREFVESLRKAGKDLLSNDRQGDDPVDLWMGAFKGKCSSSEEYARSKAAEKLLER